MNRNLVLTLGGAVIALSTVIVLVAMNLSPSPPRLFGSNTPGNVQLSNDVIGIASGSSVTDYTMQITGPDSGTLPIYVQGTTWTPATVGDAGATNPIPSYVTTGGDGGYAQTSNCAAITIPLTRTIGVDFFVQGCDPIAGDAGKNCLRQDAHGLFQNGNGTAVQVGTTITGVAVGNGAQVGVSFAVSGATVIPRVTGDDSGVVTGWYCYATWYLTP